MIQGVRLKKLLAQHVEKGSGPAGYRQEVRKLLGISESVETGEPTIDRSARAIHPKDFSFQEVAHTFLGSDYAGRISEALSMGGSLRLQEAEGGVVLPSHFANISAFSDTVGGLIDVMILEAYNSPEFIGDEFFEVKEARVQGGKIIGVRNDGNVSDNLLDGEPYPTVGLGETYVHIPDNQRFGNTVQLNKKVFIYDRTDQIQAAAEAAGYAVRRNREIRQADCVLGRTNTYSRDGVDTNTYRTAVLGTKSTVNDTLPNDFVNAKTGLTLNDWQDLNEALQILGANKDPATGFEISIDPSQAVMFVSPHRLLNTKTILGATETQIRTPAANAAIIAYPERLRNSPNPIAEYGMRVVSSRIWYNRLLLAGTNIAAGATGALNATTALGDEATKAQTFWQVGMFKRAFIYRQILPFSTVQAPLSSEDVRRDIVAVYVASEHGVPFCREPRYVFTGCGTYSA